MTTTPKTLHWAACLLGAYAAVVVANATAMQMSSDWAEVASYPRALVRAAGMAIVVWGLLRRERWAWWLGVVLAALWAITGALAFGAMLSLRGAETDGLVPTSFWVVGFATVVLLTLAVVLLILPSTRSALKQRAA